MQEPPLGSHQIALQPSTPVTSTFTVIIYYHIHNLIEHYTFFFFTTSSSKIFGLARHRFSKIFLLWATICILPILSIKARKYFVQKGEHQFILQPTDNWYFQPAKKSTYTKTSLKKRDKDLCVQKCSITFKTAFNSKLISRCKFQTKRRKLSFSHMFTVILVPSTVS